MANPEVSLREITQDTLKSILRLKVSEAQRNFVASNAQSIAEAYFAKDAWFRAIYAGDTPVGFVMLSDMPEKAEYFLWRMMVDENHQGKSYGRDAMRLLVEHVKTRPNAKELYTSHVKGEGDAGGFYQKLGFEYTGQEDDGELVMRLTLT